MDMDLLAEHSTWHIVCTQLRYVLDLLLHKILRY